MDNPRRGIHGYKTLKGPNTCHTSSMKLAQHLHSWGPVRVLGLWIIWDFREGLRIIGGQKKRLWIIWVGF